MTKQFDTEKLKELAHYATRGQWWIDSHGEAMVAFTGNGMKTIFKPEHSRDKAHRDKNTGNLSYWNNDADASWIAAAQPLHIMELVKETEQLRDDVLQVQGAIKLALSMIGGEPDKEWAVGVLQAIADKLTTMKGKEDDNTQTL